MRKNLRATFVGHQTWLVGCGPTWVAVDPVLCENFGHTPGTDFRVYPPRRVDHTRLPPLSAVFLSHEHLDHFHIPSIALLDRSIPIYFGPMMPVCVETILIEMGFEVRRIDLADAITIGDLEVTLYSAGAGTVPWEQAVTSILIRHASTGASIFIAVDALISERYVAEIKSGAIPSPTLLIVSNNSQIVPQGGFGAHTNLLPINDHETFAGIRLLSSIFLEYLGAFSTLSNVAICGNGFVNMAKPFGPFEFSDNTALANAASALTIAERVIGPMPGDEIELNSGGVSISACDFVELDRALHLELLEKQRLFRTNPVTINLTPLIQAPHGVSDEEMLDCVLTELNRLGTILMASPTGRAMMDQEEYLDGALGPLRALFWLKAREATYTYAFDVSGCLFRELRVAPHEALREFPFGIEMFLTDLYGIFAGSTQIWDLAATNIRSWYLGSKYTNLVAFLFFALGEQSRPDLALKLYRSARAAVTPA